MFIIKIVAIVVIGLIGMGFSLRSLRKHWLDYRSKPKGSVKVGDLVFNFGLSFLWFAYLFVFFGGLIVNNLIIK